MCPMLAPLRRLQEPIDELLVGVRRGIVDQNFDFGRRRRQAAQVQARAAGQGAAIRLGRRSEPMLPELGRHEIVDRGPDPGKVLGRGRLRPRRRDERPVRLILGPLGNPLPQSGLLLGGQRFVRGRRRHPVVGIVGEDPPHELTVVRPARRQDRGLHRCGALVQSQPGLPRSTIRPVTAEAVFRQQRPDVAVVSQILRLGSGGLQGKARHRNCQGGESSQPRHTLPLIAFAR